MADAPDLGSGPVRGRGSSPLSRTNLLSLSFFALRSLRYSPSPFIPFSFFYCLARPELYQTPVPNMKIELKQNCKYALLVPTSMGVRITPPNGAPVHAAGTFMMQ